MNERIRIERGSGNVFQDVGFPKDEAQNLLLRAELMLQVERYVKRSGVTQLSAAKSLGITQLANYINDPLGNDNRGILAFAYLFNYGQRATSIYEGRIRELKKQIENFKKQLEECELIHGKK